MINLITEKGEVELTSPVLYELIDTLRYKFQLKNEICLDVLDINNKVFYPNDGIGNNNFTLKHKGEELMKFMYDGSILTIEFKELSKDELSILKEAIIPLIKDIYNPLSFLIKLEIDNYEDCKLIFKKVFNRDSKVVIKCVE